MMRTSSLITGLASCAACLLAGAPVAAQGGTPFTVTYTFDTTGLTACGTNENSTPQVDPSFEASASEFFRTGVACADAVDDAFGGTGFDTVFRDARSFNFSVIQSSFHDVRFDNEALSLIVSRTSTGPDELRIAYSAFTPANGTVPGVLTVIPLTTVPTAHSIPLTGIQGAPVTFFLQPRYSSGVTPDPQGAVYVNNLSVSGETLPVELTSFEAQTDGDAARLRWTTASETNNAGFHVEHRAPGATAWAEVAFAPGRGTTSDAQRYERRIGGLVPGAHRFRLRQVDIDGAATLSAEVEAIVAPPAGLALSAPQPNPGSHAVLTLTSDRARRVTVAVYDALGRRVAVAFEGSVGAGEARAVALDGRAWGLSAGAYLVRADGDGAAASRTFVVR